MKHSSIILLACSCIFLLSCQMTTNKVKDPVFTLDTKSLSRDVNGVIQTEEIGVEGLESITNGKSVSRLNVSLVNAENLPADSSIRNSMLEHVAVIIKHSLRDTGEFDSYKILFVNKTQTNGVTNSVSEGKIFKSEEIKPYFFLVTVGERFDTHTHCAAGKSIFSRQDTLMVSSLLYSDYQASLTGQLRIYKETDSAEILLTTRDMGTLETGNVFYTHTFNPSKFYETPQLASGTYKFEYRIGDRTVGIRKIKLL